MTIGLLFWILMVLTVILNLYWEWPADRAHAGPFGGRLLLFILLFLLGWQVFGFVVKGP